MNITYRIDKKILYIAVEGKVDASNAADVEKQIFEIKNHNCNALRVVFAVNFKIFRRVFFVV